MGESISLIIGLVVGLGLDRLLLVTGSSRIWIRADTEVPDTPAELVDEQAPAPPKELADVRFGHCQPTLYDPEAYDEVMQCPGPDGTGHDLLPGERVMAIDNPAAPGGKWLVCPGHVWEPKVWGADA